MCNVLPSMIAANMVVAYKQAGLDYARRPGWPVSSFTAPSQNIKPQFFPQFGLGTTIAIPPMTTTIVAEDFSCGGAVEPGVRDKLDLGRWPFF
jgi:hypothetical protein